MCLLAYKHSLCAAQHNCVGKYKCILVVKILALLSTFLLLVITITFDQSTYSIDESGAQLVPTISLSNPASFDFTVRVLAVDGTATGEYC